MKHLLLTILLFVASAIPSVVQGQLRFDTLSLEMPITTDADTLVKRIAYHFRNTGAAPALILQARADCPCTKVVHFPTDSLSPGAEDSIVVEYTPRRVPGTIHEQIRVELSANQPGTAAYLVHKLSGLPSSQIIQLQLTGEVLASQQMRWSHLPVVMGPLRLKRDRCKMVDGEVMRILCANVGTEPLAVTAVAPPYLKVQTDPLVLLPGKEADLVITPLSEKMPTERPLRTRIELIGLGEIAITLLND